MSDGRAAFIAEAHTWIGTPYHHAANVKGAGVDCAMLLVECARVAGWCAKDYDPRPYPQHWYLHREEERFMAEMFEHAVKTEDPIPGDVALYRFGRCASHGAILVAPDLIIHSYQKAGVVLLQELRALTSRVDSFWRVR